MMSAMMGGMMGGGKGGKGGMTDCEPNGRPFDTGPMVSAVLNTMAGTEANEAFNSQLNTRAKPRATNTGETLPICEFRDGKSVEVGRAQVTTRPWCLNDTGPGIAEIDPLKWSLSVENWIAFVHACMNTDTWDELAKARGDEGKINMYDVKDHFIVPYTKGTGCSVALLMDPDPAPVQLMLSHGAGSCHCRYNSGVLVQHGPAV